MLRSTGFYVAIALGLLLAVLSANPVRVLSTGAPARAFSAERAMADVSRIARAPHPIGSAENARVRDTLAARLDSLGFTVEVWRAPGVLEGPTLTAAWPETLVAVRAGQRRDLAPVAIMSHYDSAPGSPGAADDAAGIAASLEVARALAADGPTVRDLVLIVTDGEEAGLLGARAFFTTHPLAKRLGALINLEARGSSGPAMMFETSAESGALVRRYARAAPHAVGNSAMGWVYARLPNGTDFTPAKAAGVAGVNIAFIGRPFDYHSASATPANLDRRSLQSMGDQTLGAARDLLRAEPLPGRGPDLVYADLVGFAMVAYPVWMGWVLLALAAGLIVLAVRRRGAWPPGAVELARGAGALALILASTTLVLRFLGRIVPPGETFYQGRPGAAFELFLAAVALTAGGFALAMLGSLVRGKGRRRALAVIAALALGCSLAGGFDVVALILAGVSLALAWLLLGRPTTTAGLWGGALALGLVLAATMQLVAPQTAFLATWPLLAGASLAATGRLGAQPGRAWSLAAIVVGVLAFAWLARLAAHTFDAVGLSQPEALAIYSTLAVLVLAPLAIDAVVRRGGEAAAGLVGVVGLALALFVALHDPASPRTPRPSHLLYVSDLARGRTLRVSALAQPDAWTREALGAGARREDLPAMMLDAAWTAPTAPGVVASPRIVADRDGARARLAVAAPGAREIRLSLKAPLTGLTLAGVPVEATANADGWVRLRWFAPRDGFTLTFDAPPGGAMDYRIAAISDGWPAGTTPLAARPADVMPWQGSDGTVVMNEGTVNW
jgi:hypothetical protein